MYFPVCQTIFLSCCSYLYCLPVVNFHNVKAETVDSFSGGHKDTPGGIKMAANVYQDLRGKQDEERRNEKNSVIC